MTAANREHANALRVAELNAKLDPLGDSASRDFPGLWNERATLLRTRAEQDRREEQERKEREMRNRAARFQPTIAAFRKRAESFGKTLETETAELERLLVSKKRLSDEYNALFAAGTKEGASVPTLAELIGIRGPRLERIELAVTLLSQADQ